MVCCPLNTCRNRSPHEASPARRSASQLRVGEIALLAWDHAEACVQW